MFAQYTVRSALLSHLGKKRRRNEDFATFAEPESADDLRRSGRLYIVADGVGGGPDGGKASHQAAEMVLAAYYADPDEDPGARLRRAMQQAGNALFGEEQPGGQHMHSATTMVAVVVREGLLTVANVGDSRAYLIRAGTASQITRDHSAAAELLREGRISEEAPFDSDLRNQLLRSVGGERDVNVDIFPDIALHPGDRILLCSDGLSRYCRAQDIARLAGHGEPEQVVRDCIDFANARGGADNITALLVEIGPGPETGQELEARGRGKNAAGPSGMQHRSLDSKPRSAGRLPRALLWLIGGLIVILAGYSGFALAGVVFGGEELSTLGEFPGSEVPSPSAQPTVAGTSVLTLQPTMPPEPTGTPDLHTLAPQELIAAIVLQSPTLADAFDQAGGWDLTGTANRIEGAKFIAHDPLVDSYISWSRNTQLAVSDCYIEVLASFVGECQGHDAYGLVARVDETDTLGYALEFSCDGSYRVRKFLAEGSVDLIPWMPAGEIGSGPAVENRLGFLLRGNSLYAVAGRKILGSIEDGEYSRGSIAMYAFADVTPGLQVALDELAVWELP
jgi:serine/threonine protein phosphatase PrpC